MTATATTVDTLLSAVQTVQKQEQDVARVEGFVLAEKDFLGDDALNELRGTVERRRKVLSIRRQQLDSSIRVYLETTAPVEDVDPATLNPISRESEAQAAEVVTLGDIANAIRHMVSKGASIQSIEYALSKVAEEMS